jgi:hypothetical protein
MANKGVVIIGMDFAGLVSCHSNGNQMVAHGAGPDDEVADA